MDVTLLLDMAAEAMADRVAFGSTNGGLTYGSLAERARAVAGVLADPTVQSVGFLAENSEVLPSLLFGASLAGLPFAPLNYRLADDALRSVARRLAPAVVVASAVHAERISALDEVRVVTPEELLASEPVGAPVAAVDPDSVCVQLFTSGTSGEPKAALLRHRHLAAYVLSSVEFMGAAADEATLVSVPPYHIAAVAAVLTNVYAGRRVVYLPQFEPEQWVATAAAESVTSAMVVPTMLGRLLDVLEATGERLPALRNLSYGGGRMPLPTIERALRLLPDVGFVNAYGLTETSSTIALLGPEDHRIAVGSDDPVVRQRLASVGQPLPGLEVEIRDPDGRAAAVGEPGEIHVRGAHVSGEYQTGSVLSEDGWFATNDGGFLDAGGYLYVTGRLDDVIVRGGENLSPGEIEDALLEHPAVFDVGVAGIPDTEWGEVVAAGVVRVPGSEVTDADLQDWVRTQLRGSRVPAVIAFVEELPYLPTGKLIRRELRNTLVAAARHTSGS